MKKFLAILLLLVTMFPFAAKAQSTLTVNDGTTTNSYVPVYGLYADSYLKCQMIYSGDMLTDMAGGTISSLTFYLSQSAADKWTSTGFQVYMAEYEGTTISSYIDAATATTVYTGKLDATGSTMTVTFTTPYVYEGGNLLIGVNNNTPGNYKSASFYGVSASGACVQGYSGSSLAGVSCNQRSFLPKTTFEYMISTGLTVTPTDFGTRPNGAWMEPVAVEIAGGMYNVTAVDLDNDYFATDMVAPFTTPAFYNFTTGSADEGEVTGNLTFIYGGSKEAKMVELTANAYNPANGDVYEKATVIANPASYTNTPVFANLYRNYNLPGDAEETEAVDAAYKMTFDQDVMYLATVGDAADGNTALYGEDFGGEGGPMATNAYTYNGPKTNPVEFVDTWYNPSYTGSTTFMGYETSGMVFGYCIPASVIAEYGLNYGSIIAVEAAAREAYPYNLYMFRGETSPESCIYFQAMEETPTALSFFHMDLNTPVAVGDENIWVFFDTDSPWSAYCGKYPVNTDTKIWYTPNGTTWYTSTSYTPKIYCHVQTPEGETAVLNLADMNVSHAGGSVAEYNDRAEVNSSSSKGVEYAEIMAKRDELRGVTTVLEEGFEGGSVPTGWIKSGSWAAKTSAGSYTAKTGSYSAFMTGTSSWQYESIVSKAIDLTNATSASLSFDYVTGGGNYGYNPAFVYVKEVQETSEVGTSIFPYTDLIYDQVWTNHVYDISAYCGKTVYVQFASMDFGAVCGIDNVKVTAEMFSPATDGIFVPAGTYYAVAAASEEFTYKMGTAAAPAPQQAIVLYPYDGMTDVESPFLAQWVLGDYTKEMQVKLGTQYPPQDVLIDWTDYLQEGAPLWDLLPNTTYYLQVNERNLSGTTEGEIIGFTTVLESPVAAVAEANLYPGDAAQLTWTVGRSFRGYNVYVDGERWNETIIEDDEYAVEGLAYGQHTLNVTAVYDEGESSFSNSVTVNMTGFGQVAGIVYEIDGETPIADVTVGFVGTDIYGAEAAFAFTTAEDGTFTGDVLEGNFTPIATKDGYQDTQLNNVTIVYNELTDGLEFVMREFFAPVGEVIAEEIDENSVNVSWTWTPASLIEDFEHDGAMPEGWTNVGNYGFEITTNSPYEGTYCMKSTNYNVASSTAAIEVTVEVPYDAKMSFYIKPSSESNYDKGYFYLDGVEKCNVSGAGSWAKKEYSITAGTHTYKWAYTKDSSVNSNDDCIYVDYVTLYEKVEPTPPIPGGVTYDFEDSSYQGWTSIDSDGDGYTWMLASEKMGTGYGHESSSDCMLSQSYDNGYGVLYPDNYLVSPSKLACQAGAMVALWACGQDASYCNEHFGVAVSTTGNTSASDFTTIAEWTIGSKGAAAFKSAEGKSAVRGTRDQSEWMQYTVDLSSYAGQEVWVAIRHFNCSDMFYLDVDDILLADGSAKAVAGGRSFTGAYNVYRRNNITLDETPEAVLLTTTADTTYVDETWETATPGVYQWGVAATYEGNRTRESVSFSFDSDLEGWTNIDADGDGHMWYHSSLAGNHSTIAITSHTGAGHLMGESYCNGYGALTPNDFLVSPQKYGMANGSNVTFYACAQDENYSAEHFGVAVSTTGNTSASDFTTIAEWTLTAKGNPAKGPRATDGTRSGAWYQYTADLSSYAGQEVWIAIRHFNCSDEFIMNLDDITINYTSAPVPPTPAGDGESEIVWSNAIEKDMYATVTVNAACNNGGSAAGATVKFTNNIENLMFEGTIDETGTLVFDEFRCGYYTLEVEKAGYTTTANGDYEIFGDMEFDILFEEIIMAAEDLYVSPTGWVKWTAILDEPTPGPGPTPGEGQWYGYDNDNANEDAIGTGGGQFSWGVMFPAGTYTGNVVTKVAAYDYMAMTGTATVYMGATAPTTAVGQTNVTMTGSAQYVEYELETPAVIDPTQNVWVIFYNASGAEFPAAVCANTGDANGRWVSLDGTTWEDLASYGLSYTFMVRAYIASGAKGEVTEIEVNNVCTGGTLAKVGESNNRQALYSIVMLDGIEVAHAPYNYYQLDETTLVEGQEYTVSVASVYATGMSEWRTTTFTYWPCENYEPGVTNFAATAENSDVTLTWTLPGVDDAQLADANRTREGNWYGYDNDNANEDAIGTGGGNFWWGIMLPAGTYEGNTISKVAAYDYQAMTGTVDIYQGGTSAPEGASLGTANVSLTGSNVYVETAFETPITIDPTQNVWIVYYNGSGASYPAAVCANTGDANGRWVSLDGSSWEDLASYGLSYTFMVRAYIEEGTIPFEGSFLGAMIFRDGELITPEPVNGTSMVDANVEAGEHEYMARLAYGDAELGVLDTTWYAMSCPVYATVEVEIECTPVNNLQGTYEFGEDGTITVELTWACADETVQGFKVYRDGAYIGTTTDMMYEDDRTNQLGSYEYGVVAVYANCESDMVTVTVDILDIEENSVISAIYPNPTNGTLYINATAMQQVTVANTLGQIVLVKKVSGNDTTIDMSVFESGIYMVSVATENGTSVKRISVIK